MIIGGIFGLCIGLGFALGLDMPVAAAGMLAGGFFGFGLLLGHAASIGLDIEEIRRQRMEAKNE